MKKVKEERFTVAKIKIEKVVHWVPENIGLMRKDQMIITTITHGGWIDSFNSTNKREYLKRLKEEVEKHLCWSR